MLLQDLWKLLSSTYHFISSCFPLAKPIEFYILFLIAEIYGLWSFWYCVHKLKGDIEAVDPDALKVDEIWTETSSATKSSKNKAKNQDPESCDQNDGVETKEKCELNYSVIQNLR